MTKAKTSWIGFREACVRMDDKFPNGVDSSQVLSEAIKRGLLSVKGKLQSFHEKIYNIADGPNATAEWRILSPQKEFTSPRSKYNPALGNIQIDATFIPYEFDFFAAQSPNDPEVVQIFSDIEINERTYSSFLNREFYWSFSGQDGRRRADDYWLAITLTLIRLERDGRLNTKVFPKAADLRREILSITDDRLDERTIRASVDAIHAAVVSGFDGTNWKKIRGADEDFDPLRSVRAPATRDNSERAKRSPG